MTSGNIFFWFDLKTCNLPEIEENQSITSAGWQTFLIEKTHFSGKNTFSCKAILLCKIICKHFTDRKDFLVRPCWGCSNLLKNIREINQSVGCTRETWKWNHRFCLETVISADDPKKYMFWTTFCKLFFLKSLNFNFFWKSDSSLKNNVSTMVFSGKVQV